MRGTFVHGQLIDPLASRFGQSSDAQVHFEHAAGPTIHHGAVDLFIKYLNHRIVIEAELTLRRILWDIEKAISLRASHLIIVMPTARSAQAARRRIMAAGPIRVPDELWVYLLGTAIARLESEFPELASPGSSSAGVTP